MRCAEHNLTGRMAPSTLFNASKIMFQILPAHSCSSPVYLTVGVDATGGGRALSRHQGHCDQAQDHGPQHCPHQPHPWHGQRRGVIKWVWKKQANFPKSDNDNVPLKWQCLKLQIQINIVIGWEMWTGQQLGCYWTWKMQGDWLRPSQRSEPVTTTDYEKPTQDAGRGRHSQCPGGGGVTSNNRGEITWQEMILWDDLRHLHQCHNTNVETMWVLRLLLCNSDSLIWHKCLRC